MLNVEGGEKELSCSRTAWRRLRVEEALMRLRVAHAARAVGRLDDVAFTLDEQRLQIDAVRSLTFFLKITIFAENPYF